MDHEQITADERAETPEVNDEQTWKDKYDQLQVATEDLLCELRIDEKALHTMATGYSPDYPGVIPPSSMPKIQISAVVAGKLFDALMLPNPEGKETPE